MRLAARAALAEHQPFDALLADRPAPERVVEVEHQALLRETAPGRDDAHQHVAIERGRRRRDLVFALQPARAIEPRLDAVARPRARDVEEKHRLLAGRRANALVETLDPPRRRSRNEEIVAAEDGLAGVDEILLDDGGAAGLPRAAPEIAQLGDFFGRGRLDIVLA